MKKIEDFYFLLCYAYAKAYQKIFGKNLGNFQTNDRAISYPITWCTITFVLPIFLLSNNISADLKAAYLALAVLLLVILVIYSFIQSRNKEKWKFYIEYFDQWLNSFKTRKKIFLFFLLIAPLWFPILCYFLQSLITALS